MNMKTINHKTFNSILKQLKNEVVIAKSYLILNRNEKTIGEFDLAKYKLNQFRNTKLKSITKGIK